VKPTKKKQQKKQSDKGKEEKKIKLRNDKGTFVEWKIYIM